jgi:hypothetical protein
LAYTVDGAIAAVASAQAAETDFNTFWFVLGSVKIADTPPEQAYAPNRRDLDASLRRRDGGARRRGGMGADHREWAPL